MFVVAHFADNLQGCNASYSVNKYICQHLGYTNGVTMSTNRRNEQTSLSDTDQTLIGAEPLNQTSTYLVSLHVCIIHY